MVAERDRWRCAIYPNLVDAYQNIQFQNKKIVQGVLQSFQRLVKGTQTWKDQIIL